MRRLFYKGQRHEVRGAIEAAVLTAIASASTTNAAICQHLSLCWLSLAQALSRGTPTLPRGRVCLERNHGVRVRKYILGGVGKT